MDTTTKDIYNQGALNMVDFTTMRLDENFEVYLKAVTMGQDWPPGNRWDFMYQVFWKAQQKHYPWYMRIFMMKRLDDRAVDFANYYKNADQKTFSWDVLQKSYEELVRMTKGGGAVMKPIDEGELSDQQKAELRKYMSDMKGTRAIIMPVEKQGFKIVEGWSDDLDDTNENSNLPN